MGGGGVRGFQEQEGPHRKLVGVKDRIGVDLDGGGDVRLNGFRLETGRCKRQRIEMDLEGDVRGLQEQEGPRRKLVGV